MTASDPLTKVWPSVEPDPQILAEFNRLLPKASSSLLHTRKSFLNYPTLSLLTQLKLANTPEKAASLKKAIVQEIDHSIDQTQKQYQKHFDEASETIDNVFVDKSYLKTHLKALFDKLCRELENFKTSVLIEDEGIAGRTSRLVLVENLELDHITQYNNKVNQSVTNGSCAMEYAKNSVKKIEGAETAYKAALQGAELYSTRLDENNQLASQHNLKETIDEAKSEYTTGSKFLVPSTPHTPSAFENLTDPFFEVYKYSGKLGNLTSKLTKATQIARDAPIYLPFYPEQLTIKNLPEGVAAAIRQRYVKFVSDEIEGCKKDLNDYKDLANGPLGAYLDRYADWQTPQSILKWVIEGSQNQPLEALIESKIKQINCLKDEFEHEGHYFNSKVRVNLELSADQLKAYNIAVQNMKTKLMTDIESETYLATTHKHLDTLNKKLKEAKLLEKTLEEKKQIIAQVKLSNNIKNIEENLKTNLGSINSYKRIQAFCKDLQTNINKLRNLTNEYTCKIEESILDQLLKANDKSNFPESNILKLKNLFIEESKKTIAQHKGKIRELETMADTLLKNQIIDKNLEISFKNILSNEESECAAAFEAPQIVQTPNKFLSFETGSKTELKHLEDLNISELNDYNTRLRNRMLESNNPNCELVKIKERTQLESLHNALYGKSGYKETCEHLKKLTTELKELSKKNPTEPLIHFMDDLINKLCTDISSESEMRVAANAVKAQTKHLNTIVKQLEDQIQKNKRADTLYEKRPPEINLQLPAIANIVSLQKEQQDFKYLSSRWQFLTGLSVSPEDIKAATELIADNDAKRAAQFVDAAYRAAKNNPTAAADLLAAVRDNKVANGHINAAITALAPPPPPHTPLLLLQNAAHIARRTIGFARVPRQIVKALPAYIVVRISNQLPTLIPYQSPISPPNPGSPYYNAFEIHARLNSLSRELANAATNLNTVNWQKDKLRKLQSFVERNSIHFLHYHQGIPEYKTSFFNQTPTLIIQTPLSNITSAEGLANYVTSMHRHYVSTLEYIQKEVDQINFPDLKLPDMYKDITWSY
jgi:hypothetical protein